MHWSKVCALALALVLTGALATETMAQRWDRDGRGREWVLLGVKTVGFRIDRDVVRISHGEEWYRERAFRRIHLVAERNDIHLLSIRLVYMNGYAQDFQVDRLLRDGEDQTIDLRGDQRYLQQIELVYRSRPNFEGRAVMKVYGEPSRRGGGPDGPPPIISGGPGEGRNWVELGCKQVSLFGRDRDSVRVGRREGRFKAIRLLVHGADVEMRNLTVIYANGDPDNIPVRRILRQGDRTQPLDLQGWQRSIERIDMTYSTVPNFKGLATVCVEGLQ